MLHDKTGLLHLAAMMKKRGIEHLIVSPGSRNAPVVSVFCSDPEFKCLTIVDERSAAFFALGMAQQLGKSVAVVCTSGTAALNYAPAIAEAFYLQVPLIVLTADRPVEWIDQGDGQTIRQRSVFDAHVRKSVQLPQAINNMDDLWYNDRLIAEVLNATSYPVPGPVHINLPFSEPLYGFDHQLFTTPKDVQLRIPEPRLSQTILTSLADSYNAAAKKMLLIGQMPEDRKLNDLIAKLAHDTSIVVLTETTSNLAHASFQACIDRSLSAMEQMEAYQPDFLITIGGPIVSKRIKGFLRNSNIKMHWNIGPDAHVMDVYQHLTDNILMTAFDFFSQIIPFLKPANQPFPQLWASLNRKAQEKHHMYLNHCAYSDLKVLDFIFKHTPDDIVVHLANSTPVRYAQLFDHPLKRRFFANRGTSGIDGSISTAAGFAYVSDAINLMISGDLSFLYDSNALWNKYLRQNFKIVVMNNGGGGIFRFIDGPASTNLLEDFFEASHQTSVRGIVEAHGLSYFQCSNIEDFSSIWKSFLDEKSGAAVLEVFTPAKMSATVLHCYFETISSNKKA
jgi:2-succinyl-5-enolpyruvyl-6-hydroxy-3-cyclohexene-1-carboxylate synthase